MTDGKKFWLAGLGIATLALASVASAATPGFDWSTVVNNNDPMPGAPLNRKFNSYNQPSVNQSGLVVIRARSQGGGGQPATHGIYTRNMAVAGSPIVRILDRGMDVPQPNNRGTRFIETPAFPRIDLSSDTIATRGNHQPVWQDSLSASGTTGIYTNPFGALVTGMSNLSELAGFDYFQVPEFPGVRFEVFPGAPSVTRSNTLVFKGNYTVTMRGETGVYYRELVNDPSDGGAGNDVMPAVLIANNTHTFIPGTTATFGSVSPPSAAGEQLVFAGFDDEEQQNLGGLYLAPLADSPPLTPLVEIGEQVPGGASSETFARLGEGGAFDGRFVGFWGAWGTATQTVRLYCPTEGNRDRIAYCNQRLMCEDTGEVLGDPNSVCDDPTTSSCYQEARVPVDQGIFVHDTVLDRTRLIAKTGSDFDDFQYWNYSGKTPCVGDGGDGDSDAGESVRWRSSAFVAVAGAGGATYHVAFKARTGALDGGVYTDPVDGIYLRRGPGAGQPIVTVVDNTMDGQELDPEAPAGSLVSEVGLEREGLRGRFLVISAKMGIEGGSEEDGMAGIYLTRVRPMPHR